ncbi:MAG TPA: hypothetical protein VFD63_16665, partial [Pyrinomonadaceae bacterium]|nr:hypothetical protein [Pyrinomonadaceae bacterium]
ECAGPAALSRHLDFSRARFQISHLRTAQSYLPAGTDMKVESQWEVEFKAPPGRRTPRLLLFRIPLYSSRKTSSKGGMIVSQCGAEPPHSKDCT